MVRLVFRPYTQVRRSICTSESLQASIRISSDFTLLKHSSPSFGSRQMCSYSNLSRSRIGRSMMRSQREISLQLQAAFTFIVPMGFNHPKTRTHVRLLGPCFKTGRMKSYDRQQPKHIVCIHLYDSRQQFRRTSKQSTIVDNQLTTEKPAQKSICCDASVNIEPAHRGYNTQRKRQATFLWGLLLDINSC